ncbi:hypothetical protein ABIA30_005432 [Mycobacterium sp. MAA66]
MSTDERMAKLTLQSSAKHTASVDGSTFLTAKL